MVDEDSFRRPVQGVKMGNLIDLPLESCRLFGSILLFKRIQSTSIDRVLEQSKWVADHFLDSCHIPSHELLPTPHLRSSQRQEFKNSQKLDSEDND